MYKQFQIFGPFEGVVDNMPAPNKAPNAFDSMVNFLCRKGRLQSRPAFTAFGNPPDGAIVRNALTYQDILDNFHSLVLTTKTAYALTAGPTFNKLPQPASIGGNGSDLSGTGLPYGLAAINDRIYFSNGSVALLYTDGSANLQKTIDAPGSAYFLGVLGNHALMINTVEPAPNIAGSINYPNRIRWSASGDPNTWTGFGTGFADQLDNFGRFTGYATLGRNGYFYRERGITVGAATGDGTAPFDFEPFSNNIDGVGNAFDYSLGVYGNLSVFVARNDIYTFDGSNLNPIGGKAKKSIFADLALSSGDVVTGTIVPNLGPNFDCLSYWLSIPGPNSIWVYLFDDGTWQPITSGAGRMTFIGSLAVS